MTMASGSAAKQATAWSMLSPRFEDALTAISVVAIVVAVALVLNYYLW